MKRIYLILSIALFTLHCYSQNQTWEWAKNAIGTNFCGGDNAAQKIKVGASGSVYIMGNFIDDSLMLGNFVIHNSGGCGNQNAYLLKADAFGNFVWLKSIGIGNLIVYGFDIDANENCFITGGSNPNLIIGTDTINNTLFFAKFDSSSNSIWAKSCSSEDLYIGNDYVNADAFGNIYVFGQYSGDSISFGSLTVQTINSDIDQNLFLAKFDSTGNPIWLRCVFGPDSYAKDVTTDVFGNVFITGSDGNITMQFDTLMLNVNCQCTGQFDLYIAKYDSTGQILWAKSEGGAGNINNSAGTSSNCISTDLDGNSYIGGGFSPNSTFDSIIFNNFGAFVSSYSPSGNFRWLKSIASYNNLAETEGVKIDEFGNIYLTGWIQGDSVNFDSIILYDTINNIGTGDVFVAKYDHNGNILWAIEGSGVGQGDGICLDNSSDIYICGEIVDTMTFGNIVLPYYGYTSFIAKLGETTGEEEYFMHKDELLIYPNPTTGLVNLVLQLPESSISEQINIRIIDIMGRELFTKNMITDNSNLLQAVLDINNLSGGAYIIQLSAKDKIYNKIIIKN